MIIAALSLAVACTELGGEIRESVWLVYDRDGPLTVLPLTLGAVEVAVVWGVPTRRVSAGGGGQATLLAVMINSGLFLAAFRILTTRHVALGQIRTGAILAAIAWQLLQEVGTYYLAREFKGASATYGLFGIVLGLLAWIYLAALIVVFCAELNVVRAKRLWPRNLLTPFTDDVDLTRADKSAYTSYAQAGTTQGFSDYSRRLHCTIDPS